MRNGIIRGFSALSAARQSLPALKRTTLALHQTRFQISNELLQSAKFSTAPARYASAAMSKNLRHAYNETISEINKSGGASKFSELQRLFGILKHPEFSAEVKKEKISQSSFSDAVKEKLRNITKFPLNDLSGLPQRDELQADLQRGSNYSRSYNSNDDHNSKKSWEDFKKENEDIEELLRKLRKEEERQRQESEIKKKRTQIIFASQAIEKIVELIKNKQNIKIDYQPSEYYSYLHINLNLHCKLPENYQIRGSDQSRSARQNIDSSIWSIMNHVFRKNNIGAEWDYDNHSEFGHFKIQFINNPWSGLGNLTKIEDALKIMVREIPILLDKFKSDWKKRGNGYFLLFGEDQENLAYIFWKELQSVYKIDDDKISMVGNFLVIKDEQTFKKFQTMLQGENISVDKKTAIEESSDDYLQKNILDAARNGDIETIEKYRRDGFDFNEWVYDNENRQQKVLAEAVKSGNREMVAFLIFECFADPVMNGIDNQSIYSYLVKKEKDLIDKGEDQSKLMLPLLLEYAIITKQRYFDGNRMKTIYVADALRDIGVKVRDEFKMPEDGKPSGNPHQAMAEEFENRRKRYKTGSPEH